MKNKKQKWWPFCCEAIMLTTMPHAFSRSEQTTALLWGNLIKIRNTGWFYLLVDWHYTTTLLDLLTTSQISCSCSLPLGVSVALPSNSQPNIGSAWLLCSIWIGISWIQSGVVHLGFLQLLSHSSLFKLCISEFQGQTVALTQHSSGCLYFISVLRS